MRVQASQVSLALPWGQLARIELQPQTRLRGVSGQSWITLDHDRRDIVLGPGEEFVADSGGHAIACALRPGAGAELLVTA
ncbi:DUF2917 domain-containing protein [Rubrivivax sp. RP6-9]|uniref:DUF2917 domain-containing protein n=1 Tax=Rubrivivax sp. RP6-9 TaxID=3415750 RepID=UPI003CC62524